MARRALLSAHWWSARPALPFCSTYHLRRVTELACAKKNGLASAGHGAEAVRNAIAKSIQDLPEHLRKSLTWDQGAEMAQHERLKSGTGIDVYFPIFRVRATGFQPVCFS